MRSMLASGVGCIGLGLAAVAAVSSGPAMPTGAGAGSIRSAANAAYARPRGFTRFDFGGSRPKSELAGLPTQLREALDPGMARVMHVASLEYIDGRHAPFATCFSKEKPPSPEAMARTEQAMRQFLIDNPEYAASGRWSTTSGGSTGTRGNPATLTYSFVPDGVSIPGSNGEPTAPSNLFATMNTQFGGNTALWQSKLDQCFTAWGALTGITVTRVNDDGAAFSGSGGVGTTRGDIRISAHNIDGGFNVLAYTFFPNNGDMVMDSSESWGGSSGDYLFLRNTVTHELGHALGLGHVWPTDSTKLMEPFLSTNFDGPQDDDIRGGQRQYGDDAENDDTSATFKDLGSITTLGSVTASNRATDGFSDGDWYRFSISAPATVNVSLAPVGATYPVGTSSGSTPTINTQTINNIDFTVFASNGTTVIAQGNTQPAGGTESVSPSLTTVGNYFIRVFNAAGSVDDIQRYTLSLGACTGISITTHPATQQACQGSVVTFSVAASGTTPAYQWRKNGNNMSGQNASTLTLNGVTPVSAGTFDCVVSNGCSSVTSNPAVLTVVTPVSIFTNPSNQSACETGSATFSVAAGGGSPAYQWRKGAVNIPGANASSLTINPVAGADAGSYDCVVSNACNSLTSTAATLTVNALPGITSNPSPQTVCSGAGASFSVSATGATGFQWQKNGVNIGGATSSSYSLVSTFATDAGTYACVVSNSCGNVTSTGAVLTVNTAASVSSAPANASACVGSPAAFSVSATGTPAPTYQWRKGGFNIGGATASTYSIPSVALADAGSYDCVVTNSCGSATSPAATLTVNAGPSIGTQPSSQTVNSGASVSFSVAASGSAPLTYQWRKNTTNVADGGSISGATTSTLTINPAAAGDAGSYDVVVTNTCGTATSSAATLTVNGGCVADVDDGTFSGTPDGGVTIDDLLYYLFIFDQGLPAADVDDGTFTGTHDGGVTIDDLLYFLFRFDAGC